MTEPWNLEEAIRLYFEEGWSSPKLAKHFGTHPPTVQKRLRKAGKVLRKPQETWQKSKFSIEEVKRLYLASGLSLADIAEKIGCTFQHVARMLEKAGCARRDHRNQNHIEVSSEFAPSCFSYKFKSW